MKLALHITNCDYLSDYLDMGVEMFIVAGEYGTYTTEHFSLAEIAALTKRVKHLYVMVNGLYDEHELEGLFTHIDALAELSVEGIIFQDFGVLEYVREKGYHFDMMYNPETLNTNPNTLNTLATTGVTSAFVANVIPLAEQLDIKHHTNIPLVLQIAGVQYMMSSKRALISNYQEASGQELSHIPGVLTIKPQGLDFTCYAYEDSRGTTIYSKTRLMMLDLLKQVRDFDYLYIETLFMSPSEAIETVHAYSDTLAHLDDLLYGKYVKEYEQLLHQLNIPMDRGFIDEATIYHLEDVKRRDASERNQ